MNSYIFIFSPPYCGSTLLQKMLSTSSAVSSLPKEGQFIEEVKDIFRKDPWNQNIDIPWKDVKRCWHQYWDSGKIYLLEKSPPHIIRVNEIVDFFSPLKGIILVRNPYAHVEGLMRRNSKLDSIKATKFVISCLQMQKENIELINENIVIKYEEICTDALVIEKRIIDFLPNIGCLNIDREFNLHSIDGQCIRKIENLNYKKIRRLSSRDIYQISNTLEKHRNIMEFWGYEFYEPSKIHDIYRNFSGIQDFIQKRILNKIEFLSLKKN